MGSLGESEYNCPECDGDYTVECSECGSEYICPHCEGTGWDPEQVDIEAFEAAHQELNRKMSEAGCLGLTYEWIDHTQEPPQRLGRTGGKFGHVAVADFLRD